MKPPQTHLPDDCRLPEGPPGRFDPIAALQIALGEIRELRAILAEQGIGQESYVLSTYRLGDARRLCAPPPTSEVVG